MILAWVNLVTDLFKIKKPIGKEGDYFDSFSLFITLEEVAYL